jgi:hypothetical protein
VAPLLCCASTQVNEAISTLAIANAFGFTRNFMCSSNPPVQRVAIARVPPTFTHDAADAADAAPDR